MDPEAIARFLEEEEARDRRERLPSKVVMGYKVQTHVLLNDGLIVARADSMMEAQWAQRQYPHASIALDWEEK